jgi:hypothetical protein
MLYLYDENGTNLTQGQRNIGDLLPNEWTHIVIVRENTTLKSYRNGVLNKTITLANSSINKNTNACFIGDSNNTRPQSYDDLLIFDRALSDTEVLSLYLNKANTPKYFPTPTNEIKEGSLELATSGGVAEAINALDVGKYLKGDLSQETLFAGNLNDIQYGNYFVSSASTNLPPQENSAGFLMALYRSSAWQEQLIFFPATKNIYSRSCYNGTWGKWGSLKNIFVDKYVYYQNSSLTEPIYFKLYEQKIAGVNYLTYPIHLQGECGTISNDVKTPFDITIDFRTANTTNGVIRGYASNNMNSLVDIIPTWDNDTNTLRVYVAIKTRYAFIRLQSSVPLLSPTEERNMAGVAGSSMFDRIININERQPKTLSTPVTVGGVQQTTVEGALGALAQAGSTGTVPVGTVVTSMGSIPQGYLDCSKRMIEKFKQSDSSLFTYRNVYALLQTADGAIYAGSTVLLKSTDGSIFTQLTSFSGYAVQALLQTADGAIYAGTRGGIYKSTDGSIFTKLTDIPTGYEVWALLQTADGAIYVGTRTNGLYKSTDGNTFTQLTDFPTNYGVRALLQTADGAIYVGTERNGLYKSTDGSTFTQLSGFPTNVFVIALLQTADGAIYVGTHSNRGIYKSTDGSTFTQLSGFPTSYDADTILQTADGAIYVGAGTYGFYKSIDGSTFAQLSGFPVIYVKALLQTADGAIYVGTEDPSFKLYKSIPFRELSKTTYADLYAVVGDKFNAEAGVTDSTKFAIPLVGNDKLTYMLKV